VAVGWGSLRPDGSVQRSLWFAALLGLVGLWAIASVLSRRPFRASDAGLWIIAAGLILALVGAAVSRLGAVQGTVDLSSGQRTDTAVLDAAAELETPGASAQSVRVLRRLRYARRAPTFRTGAPDIADAAVALRVETLFGETTSWVSSARSHELDLGDAHLVLVMDDATPVATSSKKASLEFRRVDEGGWRSIALDALAAGPVEVDGLRVSLTRAYEQAVVNAAGSSIAEGGAMGMNPALELSVEAQGQTIREVLYAKFPEFTLSPSGVFGHAFRYSPAVNAAPLTGNVIECHVDSTAPGKVRMRLLKLGTELLSQELKPGETLATPWSGIQLTLVEVVLHAVEAQTVEAVEPQPGQKLPPSAVEILPVGAAPDQAFWLIEGDSTRSGVDEIRYGPPRLKLPFQLALKASAGAVAETAVEVTPPGSLLRLRPGSFALANGYRLGLDERASVLRIARDPGEWILCLGGAALLFGLVLLTRAPKAAA
jgi:hypothetical protein